MRTVKGLVLAAWIGLAGWGVAQADEYITLASTTSTEQSGLFAHLIPKFKAETGIHVRVIAVGTGQAFTIARRGDADALLVHDPAGEAALVEQGYATERQEVMYNDFVIIGPADDPADVRNADDIETALQRIADSRAPFTSRGDDSGTYRAEQRLWEQAGIAPSGRWYRELGSGMGATLNTAAAMGAYVLSDRATWATFDNRQGLEILFEGDEGLFNQYSTLRLSETRHPHLKHELARQWHEWLLSESGQGAIASYERRGEPLFFPNTE